MSTAVKLFLFFVAATLFHWAFTALLGGAGLSLNIMLVFACAACAFVKPAYGYPTAFLCGLFLDFFGVKLFGHNALVFTLCACAVYGLDKRLDFDAPIPQIIVILALGFAAAVLNQILLKWLAGFSAWSGFWPFIGGIVLNAFLAPFVFRAVRYAFGRQEQSF